MGDLVGVVVVPEVPDGKTVDGSFSECVVPEFLMCMASSCVFDSVRTGFVVDSYFRSTEPLGARSASPFSFPLHSCVSIPHTYIAHLYLW